MRSSPSTTPPKPQLFGCTLVLPLLATTVPPSWTLDVPLPQSTAATHWPPRPHPWPPPIHHVPFLLQTALGREFGKQQPPTSLRMVRLGIQLFQRDAPTASLAGWAHVVPANTRQYPLRLVRGMMIRLVHRLTVCRCPTVWVIVRSGRLQQNMGILEFLGNVSCSSQKFTREHL